MKVAGLVREEAEGTRPLYRLHGEGAAAVASFLHQMWSAAAAR